MNSHEQDVHPGRFEDKGATDPAEAGRRNVKRVLGADRRAGESVEAGGWSDEEADRTKESIRDSRDGR